MQLTEYSIFQYVLCANMLVCDLEGLHFKRTSSFELTFSTYACGFQLTPVERGIIVKCRSSFELMFSMVRGHADALDLRLCSGSTPRQTGNPCVFFSSLWNMHERKIPMLAHVFQVSSHLLYDKLQQSPAIALRILNTNTIEQQKTTVLISENQRAPLTVENITYSALMGL